MVKGPIKGAIQTLIMVGLLLEKGIDLDQGRFLNDRPIATTMPLS
jgi:hypothetical protein